MPEAINGNMDQKIPAIQIDTLLNLIQALTSVFRVTTLGGHREFPMQAGEGKICPRNIGMELVETFELKPNCYHHPHHEIPTYHCSDHPRRLPLHRFLRKDGRRLPGKNIFHQESPDISD